MNKPFSIYLDLVRFIAACLVFLSHANQRLLITDILPASNYGHSSVIVFFVLSGYVITYITATKENTLASYAASRLSRVYSVALPTLILTLVLDSIGRQLYPALYDYPFDQFALRLLGGLLFANELWTVSITTFSNVPYWSICYEIWYYVAFALFVFLPRRINMLAICALALVLGPKIILLAPLWMLGVLLYRWQAPQRLSQALSWSLLIGSIIAIILLHRIDIAEQSTQWLKTIIGEHWQKNLAFSKFFIGDYPLGILVFINFVAMRNVAPRIAPLFLLIERPIRWLAGYTFTLYLMHQPLFLFWGAVLHGNPDGYTYWLSLTALTALSVFAIGHFTENKRHQLKRWMERQLKLIPMIAKTNARSI